jgi:hypothetical protein
MTTRSHYFQRRQPACVLLTTAALFTGFLLTGTCSLPVPPRYSYETAYVDSLSVPDSAAASMPVTIRIKGSMPDPSWAFDHFRTESAGLTFIIEPVGRHDLKAGIVPQVLVAYEESLNTRFSRSGAWTVLAAGRADTLEKRIIIGR